MMNRPGRRTAAVMSSIKESDPVLRALILCVLLAAATPGFAGLFSDDEARKQIAQQQQQILELQRQN